MHALVGREGQQLTAARIARSRQQLLLTACFQIKSNCGADSHNDRLWNNCALPMNSGAKPGGARRFAAPVMEGAGEGTELLITQQPGNL